MDNFRICPICNNYSPFRLKKDEVEYFQCTNCKTLFSEQLDNDNKVGGDYEVERNVNENAERIERLKGLSAKEPKDLFVLDYGCGHGYFVKDLRYAGFNVDGFDMYNPEFEKLPERNKYDFVTMVEVAEHLSTPYVEFDCIFRSLKNNGILYVETSFVNVAEEENIELDDFHYIAPLFGHSTIYSHHGLDLLLALKGFTPIVHINRHVRCYIKNVK